jgi:hypothetical protein
VNKSACKSQRKPQRKRHPELYRDIDKIRYELLQGGSVYAIARRYQVPVIKVERALLTAVQDHQATGGPVERAARVMKLIENAESGDLWKGMK